MGDTPKPALAAKARLDDLVKEQLDQARSAVGFYPEAARNFGASHAPSDDLIAGGQTICQNVIGPSICGRAVTGSVLSASASKWSTLCTTCLAHATHDLDLDESTSKKQLSKPFKELQDRSGLKPAELRPLLAELLKPSTTPNSVLKRFESQWARGHPSTDWTRGIFKVLGLDSNEKITKAEAEELFHLHICLDACARGSGKLTSNEKAKLAQKVKATLKLPTVRGYPFARHAQSCRLIASQAYRYLLTTTPCGAITIAMRCTPTLVKSGVRTC